MTLKSTNPQKKKIKNKRTYWENKIDPLWSKIIRAVGSCEMCGEKHNLNAHHIIGRTGLNLRFDLENGVCLCVGCHYLAHNKPTKFTFWLEEKYGRELLESLHERDKLTYGSYDYEKTYEFLKDIASRM